MKKSLSHAISKGLLFLSLTQAGSVAWAAEGDGVEYQIKWDATTSSYHVYMRPNATPAPIDLSISAQVTLRVPHAVNVADNFAVASGTMVSAHAGASWTNSSTVRAPKENAAFDYLSFTPSISDARTFGWVAGQEQEVFSFKNGGKCLGAVEIMNNELDPFNAPAGNESQTNPGNEFSNLGWTPANDYLGNYGSAADCRSEEALKTTADSAVVIAGTTVTIDVLANDVDKDLVSIESFTQGSKGGQVKTNGNQLDYTPASGFTGTDTFTYTVSDGKGGTATETVTVVIEAAQPTNKPPVAVADTANAVQGTALTIAVLANDTDEDADVLSIEAVTDGDFGTVTLSGDKVVYTPDDSYEGSDTFTYTVTDGKGGSSIGTVTVDVRAKDSGLDTDDDGLSDVVEASLGTNPNSADSDQDGVADADEIKDVMAPKDTDQDGVIDALDMDDDNDGILTKWENYDDDTSPANDDTDGDSIPDYLDADDDGDGRLTAQEMPDLDKDGNPADALDSDKDAIPDYLDKNTASTGSKQQLAVPTLSQWAQMLLALLLGGVAFLNKFGRDRGNG